MIRTLFLPEKFGSYYLFGKRILGIDIGKTHISATQLYLKGSTVTLEKIVEHKIAPANSQSLQEKTIETLQLVVASCDKPYEIRTALPSSQVVFKELKLPFTQREHIAKIIQFEVEPLLPFTTDQAVIDFIITKKIPAEKSSEILVAATQKEQIAQHLELFHQAGIDPTIITVDFFALYGLYLHIPSYVQLPGGVALLDLGVQSTQIAYISHGQLRLIRTLPYGVSAIAKEVSDLINISPSDALEEIIRFGLESQDQSPHFDAIMQAISSFWKKISFTLTSFSAQTQDSAIAHVILLGGGAHIKGLTTFATHQTQVPTELFNKSKITEVGIIVPNKMIITGSSIISLATAFPSEITESFNLRMGEFKTQNSQVSFQQLMVISFLTLAILGTLLTHTIIQLRKYTSEIVTSQEQALDALKKNFKSIEPDEEALTPEVLDTANREYEQERKRWAPFDKNTRIPFLEILLVLSTKIDREELGFVAEQLIITDNTLLLKGHVKDFESLKILERELKKSKLFGSFESPQDPEFTLRIKLIPRGVV
jgi:type IV pilus assembly protein PilM